MCITRYRLHYIEYLVGLIGKHKVDPISILDLVEVTQELRRRGRAIADRPAGHSEYQYRVMLSKVSYRDKSSNLQQKKKKKQKDMARASAKLHKWDLLYCFASCPRCDFGVSIILSTNIT